ncbi:MAG TPA: efflux transporter outer membrane subunit [Alphaproteobacteria bacterium]|nr:efflux transporter outer membrane subunit [Alphaproteobacteria bacterium]
MRLRPCLSALLLLGIAGCTVGPDFNPPTADTPPKWSGTGPKPDQTSESKVTSDAAADDRWWNGFRDPELTSLIDRARDANLDLRQAALRIAEARAAREVAGARDLPTVSLDSNYTRTKISRNGAISLFGFPGGSGGTVGTGAGGALPSNGFNIPPFDLFQSGFDANWEIDLFGRTRRAVESATAQTEAAAENRNDALVSVAAEVARNYVQLRGTQSLIAITQQNLDAQRKAYDLTKAQAQGGETSNLDVEAALAEVATTEARLPALEDQKTRTINALSKLVGREPGALAVELSAAKPIPPVPAIVAIGMPSELAHRRPDIRKAEADLHAATANIGVSVADLYPRLSLEGSLGIQAVRFNELGDWASRFYNFGPNLSIPVFNGTTYANIHLEEARQQEAALAYENTVLGALHEVENAVSAYTAEQVRMHALERAAGANERSLSLAQQRYRAGLSNFLDVLDAERRLFASQTDVANSQIAIATDLVAVYKALGGGWADYASQAGVNAGDAPMAQPVAAKP